MTAAAPAVAQWLMYASPSDGLETPTVARSVPWRVGLACTEERGLQHMAPAKSHRKLPGDQSACTA